MSLYSGLSIFVRVNGTTFTAQDIKATSITITDEDEGDNEISITCEDNDYAIADSQIWKVGQLMSVKVGYNQKQLTQERSGYVIMKPTTNYDGDGVMSTVTATTKSATLAARRPQTTYGATSVRTIVSEIANRNGMALTLTGGNERLQGFASRNLSDREVLRMLADRYGYQVSYESSTILFAPRDYSQVPAIELIYRRGDSGSILSASLEVDAKKTKGGDAKAVATSVDPITKKIKTVKAGIPEKTLAISAEDGHSWLSQVNKSSTTTPSDPVPLSGKLTASVGQITKFFTSSSPNVPDIGDVYTSPDPTDGTLAALATGSKLMKQKKKGELTIIATGIPQARARQLITVAGLAKRDCGNWYVLSVKHKIEKDSGYTTEFELARHGNNTKTGERNPSPLNKQQAPGNPRNSNKTVKAATIQVSAATGKVKNVP